MTTTTTWSGGVYGWEEHAHYEAAKSGLPCLCRSLATELAPRGMKLAMCGPDIVDDRTATANEPGLAREGAEFLARMGAMVLGADNLALEQIPSTEEGNWLPAHTYLLAEAAIPLLEVVDLRQL